MMPLLDEIDQEEPTTERRSWLDYLKLITVEPSMFFYMMAFMLTSVVEQAFFVYKACKVDMGYPEELCQNLTANPDANKKVQVVVSTFHQYNDIASQAIPIFLALFIGAWSDRRGRKLLLILGILGKLWYSVWVVINSLQDTWTLNVVVWTASLPSGLTGADLSIFAAAFSYLCDVSPPSNRTIRVTILDITYLASMPIGIALGKYIFSVVNKSYTIMFSLNSALLVCSLVYTFVRLDWATTPEQKPLKLCCLNVTNKTRVPDVASINDDEDPRKSEPNCLLDFFDIDHLYGSLHMLFKKRPNHGRLYLFLLVISLGLYTFQRDERQMSYLYANLKFHWDVNHFSDFRTYQSAIYVLGTLLCIPLMGKYFKLSDTTMLLLGTTAHASARVIFALAESSWLFYLGATICSLGPVVAPVLRSMTSKIVPLKERGKVFAVLSVADTAVPLFSGTVYSQVYNATIHTYPSAIYWVTVATQMSVFLVALIIRFTSRGKPLESCAKDTDDQNEAETR